MPWRPQIRASYVVVLALFQAALTGCDKSKPAAENQPSASLKYAIGIRTADGQFSQLIPAGTALPASHVQTFTNADESQKAIEITLAQPKDPPGSAAAKEPAVVAKFNIDGIPPMPKGKLQLMVTMKVEPDRKLRVKAQIPDGEFNREFGPFDVE